jgi:16S rRNA (guanine966-N2)-methyltransferase
MGRLRIIAGSLKGRRIQVPRDLPLRPTADRVREALFSILGPAVVEAVVLDAYAGSGALGFEALSRGASRVVFLEHAGRAAEGLRAAARDLGVASLCSVLEGPVSRSVRGNRIGGPFDLILADPPYDDGEGVARFVPRAAGLLRREGRFVLERPVAANPAVCSRLRLERSARYGRCRLDFYRLHDPGGDGDAEDGYSGISGARGNPS